MTTLYTAPQLLMEVGKKIRFADGYNRINEFMGVQFTYCGTVYQVCHGYTRTNGQNDSPNFKGVALLFVSGSQCLKPFLRDSRFNILHQVGMIYVVHSGRLETEGELIAEIVDNIFKDKNYYSPVKWVQDIYPHEIMVAHDPPLVWNNHTNSNSAAFSLFFNDHDSIDTRKLKEYFREIYKKRTVAEDESREFSIGTTEFVTNELMGTPRYSGIDLSNFLRILDQWIVSDVLHLEASQTVVSS